MTHYSQVSPRLLIKQSPHVLFCEFYTVPCQWTCLCGCKSATYSSKLPLWHIYLLVRPLVGNWAKQSLGPFITAHGSPAQGIRVAPSTGEVAPRQTRLTPSEPHWGLALSALLPHRLGVGLASCTIIFSCSIILGSVLRQWCKLQGT